MRLEKMITFSDPMIPRPHDSHEDDLFFDDDDIADAFDGFQEATRNID